jgi:NADPH:quinone reductase-like Zn-dependent oxidoreductase
MHAIEVAEHGGPEVLNYVDRPQPSPGPGEVLIKAEAIGVNFVDTYFRSGLYPHEVPFVLSRPHFIRTHDEFAWRTGELLDRIGDGTIEVTVSARYPLKEVARAHRDLQSRKTIGSVVLIP